MARHVQGYEHAEGRLVAASTLRALVGKLPQALLTQWAPLFFMPLVLGLVNDEDAACRQLLAATVSDLLQVRPPAAALLSAAGDGNLLASPGLLSRVEQRFED